MADIAAGIMVAEAPAVVEVAKPTATDLTDAGISAAEIEMAEKVGVIEKAPVAPEVKKEDAPKKTEKTEKKGEELAKRPEVQEAFENPEKEQELIKTFNKNEQGLYWSQKKEREKRRAAETERDHTLIKLKAAEERAARFEAEAKAAKAQPVKATEKKTDVFGNEIEGPEDEKAPNTNGSKPITKDDLIAIEKEKQEKAEKDKAELDDKAARGQKILLTLNAQEADAKTRYENADVAFDKASEILKIPSKAELERIFPDKKTRGRVVLLANQFRHLAGIADKIEDGDINAADIAYELGQLHPEFKPDDGGKTIDDGGKPDENGGGISPEKVSKALENSKKRPSSASVSTGGGKKFVSFDDMNAEQLAALPSSEFSKVPLTVRERILRGA